ASQWPAEAVQALTDAVRDEQAGDTRQAITDTFASAGKWSGEPAAVSRPVPGRRAAGLTAPHDLVPTARMRHRAGTVARRPAHDHAAWPPGMPRVALRRIRPPAGHAALGHAS